MAKSLYNPTDKTGYPEAFDIWWGGVNFILKPGQKIKMDDKAANQAMNEFGPRGLISLDYDDALKPENEAAKVEGALRRNEQFKRRQIMKFNRSQEARRQRRQEYITPTKEQKAYAKELNLKLYEPLQMTDTANAELQETQSAKIKAETELSDTKKALAEMMETVAELTKQVAGLKDQPAPKPQKTDRWKHIGKNNLKKWVVTNKEEIEGYPDDAKAALGERYEGFYGESMPV